jgi:hypothetical protein
LEQDICLAARVLRQEKDPPLALLPALHQEIEGAILQ